MPLAGEKARDGLGQIEPSGSADIIHVNKILQQTADNLLGIVSITEDAVGSSNSQHR